jgi:IgGFc binding protein
VRRALLVFLLAFITCATHAQGYRGRDFWICFPQNAICEGNKMLQLSLYITSENRATGTIVNLLDSSNNQHFSIESGASIEREIDTEIEIRSSEQTGRNALHITSDQDISVYVVDHRPASTDSYMAIPTELLGKEYVVAGYATLANSSESFTSQATLAATEDNTLVTIHLADSTKNGLPKGRTLMVPLRRGETFQIQGSSERGDLTGSTVSATKPIAFFTGHTCAQVPASVSFCDILLEMEPPANDWGNTFLLTKFENKDYYVARVMANYDLTEVSINGVKTKTLNRGEFYEVDTFYHDAVITTSKPALVAQYCTSSSADTVKVGDPFMLIAVPSDRFIREVTTSSVAQGVWKDYLNIVVPDTAMNALQVDGAFVGAGRFPAGVVLKRKSQVPSAKSTVLTLQVASGRHLVQCTAPIAVYGYGFGIDDNNYDSYGHACGMRLDP